MPATERNIRSSAESRNQPTERRRAPSSDKSPGRDFLTYVKDYAREQPGVAAAWCFGIGFIVGWRLKPW